MHKVRQEEIKLNWKLLLSFVLSLIRLLKMKEEEGMAGNISSCDTCWVITLVMKIKICMQRLQKYHKDNLLFQFIPTMFLGNDNDNIYH